MRTNPLFLKCRWLSLVAMSVGLGVGCSSVPTYFELEFTNDCIAGAQSLRFRAVSTGGLANPADVTWGPGIHVTNDPPCRRPDASDSR